MGRELSVPGVPLTLGDSSQVPKALGQNAPALEPGGFLLPGESVLLSLLRFTAVNKSLVYRCAAFPERDCFPAQHILLWKPINEPASFRGCHCPPRNALRDLIRAAPGRHRPRPRRLLLGDRSSGAQLLQRSSCFYYRLKASITDRCWGLK